MTTYMYMYALWSQNLLFISTIFCFSHLYCHYFLLVTVFTYILSDRLRGAIYRKFCMIWPDTRDLFVKKYSKCTRRCDTYSLTRQHLTFSSAPSSCVDLVGVTVMYPKITITIPFIHKSQEAWINTSTCGSFIAL